MNRAQGTIAALVIGSTLLGVGVARSENATADIVDTAVKAGTFKTLAAALAAADLVDTLKGEGPFTVFAQTVNGQSVRIVVHGNSAMVESANVVAADIVASNGIIHVIDSVILPQ